MPTLDVAVGPLLAVSCFHRGSPVRLHCLEVHRGSCSRCRNPHGSRGPRLPASHAVMPKRYETASEAEMRSREENDYERSHVGPSLATKPRVLVAAAGPDLPWLSSYASAQPAPTAINPPQLAPTVTIPPPNAVARRGLAGNYSQGTSSPKEGCFKSVQPPVLNGEVPCGTSSQRPYPRSTGPRPNTVGNGSDLSAQVTGTISAATGRLIASRPLSRETGGSSTPNSSSLQLNTNTFSTAACSPPLCRASPERPTGSDGALFTNSVAAIRHSNKRLETNIG